MNRRNLLLSIAVYLILTETAYTQSNKDTSRDRQPKLAVESSDLGNLIDWTTINADSLSDWSDPGKWWRTENGVFIGESKGGKSLPEIHYLVWKGSTGRNFELSLEYRIIANAPQDAGLNFRVERPLEKNLTILPGYQAELDTAFLYGKQPFIKKGMLFGHIHDGKRVRMFERGLTATASSEGQITTKKNPEKFEPRKVFRKPPAWNHCLVRASGDHVQLLLNGVLANEIFDHDPKMRSDGDGIALQFRPENAYRFEVRALKFRKIDPAGTQDSAAKNMPASTVTVEAAGALALAGKHADASRMLEKIFAEDPSAMDTMGGLGLATLYAALGEKEKHQQFCEKLFDIYSNSKKPEELERPAKAYLIFSGADDPKLLQKAATGTGQALQVVRGKYRIWFELTDGMAQYRLGQYDDAVKSLSRPLRGKHPVQRIQANACLAMTAFKQNKLSDARRFLATAESEFQKADSSMLSWNDIVACKLVIKEAKTMIQ